MNKFKEEDFQIGDVFDNKMGSRYEVLAVDSKHIQIKFTHEGLNSCCHVVQSLRKTFKNFVHYLNDYNSSTDHPFYKVG